MNPIIVDALRSGPMSLDGLVRTLADVDRPDGSASDLAVDDTARARVLDHLTALVENGTVLEQHLMTNPPRTLYRLADDTDSTTS